jgi:surface antigen
MEALMKNKMPTFATLASSNHAVNEREANDFYATEPRATELLLEHETFSKNIWECANGKSHISNVLENHGYHVYKTDIVDRGDNDKTVDFLKTDCVFDGDIVTNPPYKCALQFCQKAIESVNVGNKVAMFVKLLFLEGKARKKFFIENPPKTVYVSSSRLNCVRNGDFDLYPSSAVAYAWFVWEKGFKGDTVIKWIN